MLIKLALAAHRRGYAHIYAHLIQFAFAGIDRRVRQARPRVSTIIDGLRL